MALLRLTPSFSAALVVLASCSARGSVAPLRVAAAEAKRSFDLPHGEAPTTLRQFAAAAGRSLVFVADKVSGETTNPVHGEFRPARRSNGMRVGTGLEAAQDNATGALVVSGKRTPKPYRAAVRTDPLPTRNQTLNP